MVNYGEAKIYQIRSHQTEKVYVGSTCQKLSSRMASHRANYKCYLKNKYHYMTAFEIIKFGDAYIELIKKIPCKDKEELHKQEGLYIRKLNCVNKFMPDRKPKESKKAYRLSEHGKAKEKAYQKMRRTIKFNCPCDGTFSLGRGARHRRTFKHKKYLFNLHNELNHM